ncbi:type I-E CRISPR-associated protein Cse2/CasB [Leisingera sp. D0M16]|uniref:type I-E CRISPR-associated protein Cse2/CasB n=1 Tax=Leisingera coralii TaxID=3351347 RepID=UPI003B80F3A6
MEKRPGQLILSWWSAALGDRKTGSQKALSARLRRGDDVSVLCEPAVHGLAQSLKLRDGLRVARLARVLAHVPHYTADCLPRRLGQGDPPALSPMRFERLIQSDGADLETAIRRALPLAQHAANPAHLGEALINWNDTTRIRWCFDYYGGETSQNEISEDLPK